MQQSIHRITYKIFENLLDLRTIAEHWFGNSGLVAQSYVCAIELASQEKRDFFDRIVQVHWNLSDIRVGSHSP
jgi:hypothetical protein